MTTDKAKELVERLFRDHPEKNFVVRFWDDSELNWGEDRRFTLVFKDEEVFKNLMRAGDPALFGKAYVENKFDIEGDLFEAIHLGEYLRGVKLGIGEKLKAAVLLGIPKTKHTKEEDFRDVQAHYDLSNDFYRLFLDKNMVYSCAYFSSPERSLEEAQEQKLDLICKKLRLKQGERFLDVGCGWGALPIWAAKHYGVHAHGITLSENQYTLANERVREEGLSNLITIDKCHYRDIPDEQYDKIASVGMVEHVGIEKYPDYFGTMYRLLKPGGLFLNHGITVRTHDQSGGGGEFITKYVFPGSELDTITHTQEESDRVGFEVLDVESLRRHYALTLREWMKRYSANRDKAAEYVSDEKLRIWDLYLPGCALSFENGDINVYQSLLARNTNNGTNVSPMTRDDLCK